MAADFLHPDEPHTTICSTVIQNNGQAEQDNHSQATAGMPEVSGTTCWDPGDWQEEMTEEFKYLVNCKDSLLAANNRVWVLKTNGVLQETMLQD